MLYLGLSMGQVSLLVATTKWFAVPLSESQRFAKDGF